MAQRSDSIDDTIPRSGLESLFDSLFIRDVSTPNDVSGAKAERMVELETTDLFFKGIRPDFNKRALDFFCDLTCANLGQHLDIPLVPQVPINHPDRGLGLVSPRLHGETGITVSDHSQLVNGARIPHLCVFEEWVMNTDDKTEHFRTVEQNGAKRVYAFDHGHTLHQANNVEDKEKLKQDVGQRPNPYGFESVSEVNPGIRLIKGVQDDDVRRIVRHSLDQIRRTAPSDPDIEVLLNDADTHTATVTDLLRVRRDQINHIMESKFQ